MSETLWQWRTYGNSLHHCSEFVERSCRKPTFQWLMVMLGWAKSPSEAQRLIERGQLTWRLDYGRPWLKPKFNQEIPRGWPFEIRWASHYKHTEVIWPKAHVIFQSLGRRVWSGLMPESQGLRWWAFWLDDLEHITRQLFKAYLERAPRLEW